MHSRWVIGSTPETAVLLEGATQWLLRSGIQHPPGDPKLSGGVHAWYEPQTQKYAFLYAEITGYAITTLLFLNSVDRNPLFVERAKAAASWLLHRAVEPTSGAVLCRFDGAQWLERQCTFDNGVCLNALANLYRETKDEAYLRAALRIADWLFTVVRRPDGCFYAKCSPRTQIPANPGGKWSHISGTFLVKLAIGLTNLADVSGDKRYTDAAEKLCAWGIARQEADGRFPTAESRRETFLHPHCYAAEGLLVAGLVLKREEWIEAAAKAVSWIAPHQLPSGGFPAFYEDGKFLPLESPDISSQVLRLYLLLPESLRAQIALDRTGVVRSVAASQSQDTSPAANGGIAAGTAWFHGEDGDRTGEHVNSWVTMFCAQTLLLLEKEMRSVFLLV
jgi:hypothetical protein